MVQEKRSADYKSRTEPDNKTLLGAGTTKQSRDQKQPPDGLESQHGTVNVGSKGGSQRESSSLQCGTIDSNNRWSAAILSGWCYSAATFAVERNTPKSKKGTTTKGSTSMDKENPKTIKREVIPRGKRREITREASILSPSL